MKPRTGLYRYVRRRTERAKIQRRLDALFSQVIRIRDKKCLRCGKTRGLQCSHIFTRANKAVRWDLDNAIALCGGCHIFWFHQNPVEGTEFIQKILGPEKYAVLKIKARCRIKRTTFDLLYLEEELKGKLHERKEL